MMYRPFFLFLQILKRPVTDWINYYWTHNSIIQTTDNCFVSPVLSLYPTVPPKPCPTLTTKPASTSSLEKPNSNMQTKYQTLTAYPNFCSHFVAMKIILVINSSIKWSVQVFWVPLLTCINDFLQLFPILHFKAAFSYATISRD